MSNMRLTSRINREYNAVEVVAMVKCNLSTLMGKHKMTIQDVHVKTGLSRNTIANLYHERATRADFDTIEALCRLFKCDVGDLLEIAGKSAVSHI